MNTEPEQITPMKQTPLQSQPTAKTSAHRKKNTGLNDRLSGQGRKSQRSVADEVNSPNLQLRQNKLSKRKSSIKQEKSPNMQTPITTSKSRQPKMIENSTGQDKPTYNRLSTPHTPKDTKNHKGFKSSQKKTQNDENQKNERSKSAKRKGVNQIDVEGAKKAKKVFAVSNEVINIMVPQYSTKNKFNDNAVIQTEEGGKIEIWGNQMQARDASFVDSDVADEFEYKYDPDYLSPNRNNQSPKVRMNLNTQQRKGRSSSTTPNIIKKKKKLLSDITPEKFLQSAAEEGFSESNDFIKKTCKEISSARPKRKQTGKRNFVKRMVFDITKRNTREKTFDSLKNVLHLKVGQIDTSRSLSPNREFDGEEHSHRQSQSSNFLSPKKFTPKDRDKFINRMWQYQERKEKAIEMLQGAKRLEEDAEYLQAIKNRKMTEKEKKKAHDRLIGDAVKRKLNQEQVKQQMQLQEEEQAKILFRPKINNYNKEKQLKKSMKEKSIQKLVETETSNGFEIQTQTLTLDQKIALFQQEAHINNKSGDGGRSSKKSSALAMNTETLLNFEAKDASFDADEEGQVHTIKSLKS